jgi:uncharacterized 2Fe-2S/4Fe-4S cluster protein (DUF4445 family)
MKNCQVIFQPSGKRGVAPEGKTVLEAAHALGVGIESLCGGKQTCGKCRIRVEAAPRNTPDGKESSDPLTPFSAEEARLIGTREKAEGFRLACAAALRDDVRIFIPEESRTGRQVVRKEATERMISSP